MVAAIGEINFQIYTWNTTPPVVLLSNPNNTSHSIEHRLHNSSPHSRINTCIFVVMRVCIFLTLILSGFQVFKAILVR